MKSALRTMLFVLLAAVGAGASAQQRHVLYSPLPSGVDHQHALQVARQVLVARGWEPAQIDQDTLEARKGLSGIRISVEEPELSYRDLTERRRMRQRNREAGPKLAAIPQSEIDALRADLDAAFKGNLPMVPGTPQAPPGQVLLSGLDPSTDPASVLEVARVAFITRGWNVAPESKESFIARIRGIETDSNLRVFFADGALRYIDRTTNRKGEKASVPARWITFVRADIGRALAVVPKRDEPRPAASEHAPRTAEPGDAAERLRKLKSMLDAGLISQAEYDSKRAEILGGL